MISPALGWLRFALVVVPLVLASIGVQRRVVPNAAGAEAALWRVVIGLSIGAAVLEVLGTIGQFRPGVIVGAEALIGAAVAFLSRSNPWRRTRPAMDPPPLTSRGAGAQLAIALSVAVLVAWVGVGAWIGRHGVLDNDSLRYHGPFVARWFQMHSLTHLQFTSERLQETFFPANSELVSSLGIAAFGSDWLTPLLAIGWLVVALLAGWTMVDGPRRPYGLLAVAAVAGSPLLLLEQPGSARNDMAATALALAALALARRADWRVAPMAVAGAAAGLAAGTKLSVVVPLAVVTVGLPLIAPAGRRLRTAGAWVGPMILTGGYWYARNWARTGNPLPWYRIDLGPIHLPAPPFVYLARQGQSIADYAGSAHFWTHVVPNGLTRSLGRGWVVFLLVAALGLAAAWRSRRPFPALMATAAAVAVVADVFTPYTAGGLHGPSLFPHQLRFLTAAAILALLAGVMTVSVRRLWPFPAVTVVIFAVATTNIPAHGGAVVAVLAVLTGLVLVAWRAWPAMSARRLAAAGAVVALVAGIPFAQWYVDHRYEIRHARGDQVAFGYFRHVRDARVAVGALLHTYPLAGPDLSNYVQTVGAAGAHGAFWPAAHCDSWQRLVDQGHYDYVVVGYAHHLRGPQPPEARWTARMSNARPVLRSGTTTVFRLTGPSHPPRCPTG